MYSISILKSCYSIYREHKVLLENSDQMIVTYVYIIQNLVLG